jgi:hypothetical protein
LESLLDDLICKQEDDLAHVHRHQPYRKRVAQRIHEQLTLLRAAKYLSHWHEEPVNDIERPDELRPGGIDLIFRCGSKRYAIEHTTIESFHGQRAWVETGRLRWPLPGSLADLPETRRACIAAALENKLGKLARYAERIRETHGNCTAVLLLEFEDYWHSNDSAFLKAIGDTLSLYQDRLPDQIHLVSTVYLMEGDLQTPDACRHIPSSDVIFSLELDGYRTGTCKPILRGPVKWFREERDWFAWP